MNCEALQGCARAAAPAIAAFDPRGISVAVSKLFADFDAALPNRIRTLYQPALLH